MRPIANHRPSSLVALWFLRTQAAKQVEVGKVFGVSGPGKSLFSPRVCACVGWPGLALHFFFVLRVRVRVRVCPDDGWNVLTGSGVRGFAHLGGEASQRAVPATHTHERLSLSLSLFLLLLRCRATWYATHHFLEFLIVSCRLFSFLPPTLSVVSCYR